MKIGSFVFSTDQGIGILAHDAFRHGLITHPVVLKHGKHMDHPERFPGCPFVNSYKHTQDVRTVRDHLASCDAVLFIETPFDWGLIPYLQERHIRTALLMMYECMPDPVPARPHLFICPSALDYAVCMSRDYPCVRIDVPVEEQWRARGRVEEFVSNLGHGGLRGRNGSKELLEAVTLLISRCTVSVRTQQPLPTCLSPSNVDLTVTCRTLPRSSLYVQGQVFVHLDKFSGLSLPLQEAFAAGMAVVAPNRYPYNRWLPRENLVRISGEFEGRIGGCVPYLAAEIRPVDVAAAMDRLVGTTVDSEPGRAWAAAHTWEKLVPQYLEVLL